MEEELINAIPCSSITVESVLRVGTAGAIWGFCSAPYDARQMGLTGIARASFVAKSVGRFGAQCGLVAAIFSATCCGLQRYRKQNDRINTLIAGSIAGAAVAARSRSWKTMIETACLVSAFSTAADMVSRTN